MPSWITIFRRELADYFYTPIAYVFLVIFLVSSSVLTIYVGGLLEREQADLLPFFSFHPWLYLVLAPALGMRLWAEERKTGTIQTLLTLPVSTLSAAFGKFLASWVFAGCALILTFPIWLTVNFLGNPDNGVIWAGYLASFLMVGGFLAVSSCMSALTQNQVVAFVLGVLVNLFLILGEFVIVKELLSPVLPQVLIETIVNLSYLTHFGEMSKGVISLDNIVFFLSVLVLFVYLTVVAVDSKRSG
ncbi:MAG: hypothetical protein OXI60_06405 [Acidiferrobacterales bacterium]|nr:hypothetical protein [Acidiferrobacterales bacterium]